MKPLVNSIGKHLPPLKLYLDDLEYIVQLLESVSSEVTIKTREHELANLSELSTLKKKVLRELHILSKRPWISLDLTTNSVFLYTEEDLPANVGVFEQIYNRLIKGRTHLLNVVRWCCILLSLLLTVIILVDLSFRTFTGKFWLPDPTTLIVTCLNLVVLVLFFYFNARKRFYTTVIPKHRIDAPSFWENNWEKIAVAVFIALISFALGWLSRFLPGPK